MCGAYGDAENGAGSLMHNLVLATHNDGKAREISALLKPYVQEFYTAKTLNIPEPEETEDSFIGNALLKARHACAFTGKPALSDDSGLCVNALDGAPGIYSARWAYADGSDVRDFDYAMKRVWDALSEHQDKSAYFVCALALVTPDGTEHVFEGYVHGTLLYPPRGDKGFGYDPIFLPKGHDITFGEMNPADKHAMSHRADAFAKLVDGVFS